MDILNNVQSRSRASHPWSLRGEFLNDQEAADRLQKAEEKK